MGKKRKLDTAKTNAVTDIKSTKTEGEIPISSDLSVEEARDWSNENQL